jgi:hypothetical protein
VTQVFPPSVRALFASLCFRQVSLHLLRADAQRRGDVGDAFALSAHFESSAFAPAKIAGGILDAPAFSAFPAILSLVWISGSFSRIESTAR